MTKVPAVAYRLLVELRKPDFQAADALLPEHDQDASGVGVNYADAVLKAMKSTLDDGRKVLAKRRGLKITLKVGEQTFQQNTTANTLRFDGIKLPKDEVRLEAIRQAIDGRLHRLEV